MKVGKYARFPDAQTIRGLKHLENLIRIKKEGKRAVMIYVIQRQDTEIFGPAWHVDPNYSEKLCEAYDAGVEIFPLRALVTPNEIQFPERMSFNLERHL